eukprot:IDg23102t1
MSSLERLRDDSAVVALACEAAIAVTVDKRRRERRAEKASPSRELERNSKWKS